MCRCVKIADDPHERAHSVRHSHLANVAARRLANGKFSQQHSVSHSQHRSFKLGRWPRLKPHTTLLEPGRSSLLAQPLRPGGHWY
jgi:hypothetical protein